MLNTRNLILVTAIVVAAHVYSSTVEAQLFRRNRCCKSSCQPCCPAPAPQCCTPAPACPPVQCCPGTAYAPMMSPTPASGGGQWMAAPDPCNVWISDPKYQGVIVEPAPSNDGGDGPPQEQACLALYTECMEGCATCTGADATACQRYCSTKRNNCSLPPRQRVDLPDPPACYQPPGVGSGPGG